MGEPGTGEPTVTIADVMQAACVVCGVTADELADVRGGKTDLDASRARMLVAVVAIRLGHPQSAVMAALGMSKQPVFKARCRFADRVADGDERLAIAADRVEARAWQIALGGHARMPSRPAPAAAVSTETPWPPRRKAKPGPKPRPSKPRETAIGPSDLLPAAEVIEARDLRRKGWSLKGLTRRFQLDETAMRIVIGEPVT